MFSSRVPHIAQGLLLCMTLLLAGCPRGVKLPEQSSIGGLLVFDYAGIKVMHQYSARDYVHIRLHFGWQKLEENSHAAECLAVEAAFTGGAGDYSPAEFAAKLEAAGATLEFLPQSDGPVVVMNCLPDRLNAAWELLTLCLADPLFDKTAYQSLRQSRVAAQKALEADLTHLAWQSAVQETWPGAKLDQGTGNSVAELEAVARTTAQATFTDLMRQRCNLRLVTVGPIDAERISDLLLSTADALPEGECLPETAVFDPPRLQQARLVQDSRGMEALAGVFPGPPAASATALPMRLAMQIVAQRLHRQLVGIDHVAIKADARYVAAAPSHNLIQVTGSNAFQCAEFALSELRKLKANGFGELEVAHAKQALLAQYALGYESAGNMAARLDAAAELDGIALTGNEHLLLEAADAKRLTAVLREYLTGISWGIVGDTADIDRKSLQRL